MDGKPATRSKPSTGGPGENPGPTVKVRMGGSARAAGRDAPRRARPRPRPCRIPPPSPAGDGAGGGVRVHRHRGGARRGRRRDRPTGSAASAARWSPPTPARRLDRRQRRLPDRRRRSTATAFTADVMGETLAAQLARRAGARATRSTSSAPPPLATRLGGHSSRATSTASAHRRAASPGETGRSVRFTLPAGSPGTWWRRARSPSTASRSRSSSVGAGLSTVGLIPTTLGAHHARPQARGDPVNLEVDVIAKYVEKLLGGARHERPLGVSTDRAGDRRRSPPAGRSSSSTTPTARTRAT